MNDQRIILFRGMNTGGVRAPVAEQRAMAEAMGLKNPRTLLASGNLVVESDMEPDALEVAVEQEMARRFNLQIAAMVRTPDQWSALIAANPFAQEAAADPARLLAMTMKAEIKPGGLEAVRAFAVGEEKVEAVRVDGRDILYFWHPEGIGQSKMADMAQPRLIGMGTARNWNTVLKLGQMVEPKV